MRVGTGIGFGVTRVVGKATGVEKGRKRGVGSVLGDKLATMQTHVGDCSAYGFGVVAVWTPLVS